MVSFVSEKTSLLNALVAHIHEGLQSYFIKSAFYLRVLAKPTLLFMQIILYCMAINLKVSCIEVICLNHQRILSTITCTYLVITAYQNNSLQELLRIVSTMMMITKLYCLNSVIVAFIHCHQLASASLTYCPTARIFLFELASFASGSLESLPMLE